MTLLIRAPGEAHRRSSTPDATPAALRPGDGGPYAAQVARIPGVDSAFALLQAQAAQNVAALTALPGAVASLTSAVRSLGETAQAARETLAALQRLTMRLDALADELEEPVRALAPGLQRLAVVLDDPIVDEIPETLRQVQGDVLPVLRTLADTHERVAFIAGSTERIMTFVDETSRTIAGIPGAALLGRRRTGVRVTRTEVVDAVPADRPEPPPSPEGPTEPS
jgi:ABC-type transporter Mla subunit MlaD